MRIAIDASRTTVRQRTGTENYALQLIRHLLPSEHELHLYFRNRPPDDLLPRQHYHQHVIPLPRLWTHLGFAAALWRTRPDVTWVPAHTLPRYFPGKAVVTVHDLGYLYFPEAHPIKERRYLDFTTRYSANRATLVLADSVATQQDLNRHYDIPIEKVRVVYPGVDESLHRIEDTTAMRHKYQLPARYLFFLGTLQPRKNIARLVRAFAQWQAQSDHKDVVLALGGKPGWLYDPAWTADVPNVRVLGYVADEDIAALYSGAIGLVLPSLYEGFGFPVVEALRCGTPVLCSNISSLPELTGEAGILVDPLSVGAIAQGIQQLVEDENLRAHLISHSTAQAHKFTWEAAARAALKALEDAAR